MPTVHLGGSYKDANNADVIINNEHFENLLKKLNLRSKIPISIIIHPRTFKDIINKPKEIRKRFFSITEEGKLNQNIYFFVPQKLYDIVSNEKNRSLFLSLNIEPAPPYNGILYAINELDYGCQKIQFVSVDQYNAFSDIKCKINGFLLNNNDKNQEKYLSEYRKLDLNSNILKNFLKVLS